MSETIQIYLRKTETACRLMFDGVADYHQRLRAATGPVFVSSYSDEKDLGNQYDAWRETNAAEIASANALWEQYFAEILAQATLAGSILQIAHAGIQRYSTNKTLATDFSALKGRLVSPFCIGRRVRDVPLGLVILAGRNQHMHFADGEVHLNTRIIFDRLALGHGHAEFATVKDAAFDIDNEGTESFAHNILALIGWRDYATFERDMLDMLITDDAD